MAKVFGLSRHDVEVICLEKEKAILRDTHNYQYTLPFREAPEHPALLDESDVMIEFTGKDYFVLRDQKENLYLLPFVNGAEELPSRFTDEELKHELPLPESKWLNTYIYGYCNGFFDRDHYNVSKHLIEAVGVDWIVARDADQEGVVGDVYLAHFDELFIADMDKFLTDWSDSGHAWDFSKLTKITEKKKSEGMIKHDQTDGF